MFSIVAKLNQIIAVEKGVKSKSFQDLTEAHHAVQKAALLSSISRSYQPKDEEGEQLPPSTRVQVRTEEVLRDIASTLTRLFEVTATKDTTNCVAKANVVVDGETLLTEKLPVLDAAESWVFNDSADCWSTEPVRTIRTKKVPRNHVKAEATEKHPAQVEVYYEDVSIGYWTTVKFSGALPAKRVSELLERVEKLQHAVKFAREEANNTEVVDRKVGD